MPEFVFGPGDFCPMFLRVGFIEWEEFKEHYNQCDKCPKLARSMMDANKQIPGFFLPVPTEIEDPLEFLRTTSMLRNRANDLNDGHVTSLLENVKDTPHLLQDFVSQLSDCLMSGGYEKLYRISKFVSLAYATWYLAVTVGSENVVVLVDKDYIDKKERHPVIEPEEVLEDLLIMWGQRFCGLSEDEVIEILDRIENDNS